MCVGWLGLFGPEELFLAPADSLSSRRFAFVRSTPTPSPHSVHSPAGANSAPGARDIGVEQVDQVLGTIEYGIVGC